MHGQAWSWHRIDGKSIHSRSLQQQPRRSRGGSSGFPSSRGRRQRQGLRSALLSPSPPLSRQVYAGSPCRQRLQPQPLGVAGGHGNTRDTPRADRPGSVGPVPQGSELILITTAHSSDARGPPKGWGGAVKTRNNSPSEDCNELNQHRIMFEKHQPTEVSTLLPSSRIC